jgi:hypothetical protein
MPSAFMVRAVMLSGNMLSVVAHLNMQDTRRVRGRKGVKATI